jgi:hypothetical protein
MEPGASMEQFTLTQRHGIFTRTYILDDEAVLVKESHFLSRSNYKVPYATLSNEKFEMTVYSKVWLWLTVIPLLFCFVVFLGEFLQGGTDGLLAIGLYGTFALFFGVLFYHSMEKVVGFQADDGPLVFSAGKPSQPELDRFLKELSDRKETFLRNQYLQPGCGHSPADELQKLMWLRDQGALTPLEFDKLKQDVVFGVEWGETDNEPVN